VLAWRVRFDVFGNFTQGFEISSCSSGFGAVPPHEAWLKSEELLTKALQMDNTSSRAHTLLGMLKFQFRCDRTLTVSALRRVDVSFGSCDDLNRM
jgi:hypothetical protein